MSTMTPAQAEYLLQLINDVYGKSYRWLSQVQEDRIGKTAMRVRGISKQEASALIKHYKDMAKQRAQ